MITLDSLALCENEWAGHERDETDVWQRATFKRKPKGEQLQRVSAVQYEQPSIQQ